MRKLFIAVIAALFGLTLLSSPANAYTVVPKQYSTTFNHGKTFTIWYDQELRPSGTDRWKPQYATLCGFNAGLHVWVDVESQNYNDGRKWGTDTVSDVDPTDGNCIHYSWSSTAWGPLYEFGNNKDSYIMIYRERTDGSSTLWNRGVDADSGVTPWFGRPVIPPSVVDMTFGEVNDLAWHQ